MNRFLVHIEAVNFDESILDTNDLSVIRGGGYANLLIPLYIAQSLSSLGELEMAEGDGADKFLPLVYDGASQAQRILRTEKSIQEVEAYVSDLSQGRVEIKIPDNSPPELAEIIRHLSIVSAVIPFPEDIGYEIAANMIIGQIRKKQMMQLSFEKGEPVSQSFRKPCDLDGVRPAVAKIRKGFGEEVTEFSVSRSVKLRYDFGRDLRREIYQKIGIEFPEEPQPVELAISFNDIIKNSPQNLVPSLANKMAVICMDGNKFTEKRSNAIKERGGQGAFEFSRAVLKWRSEFLQALIDTLWDDPHMFLDERFPDEIYFRFSTLMWGGDESCFVLPAWKFRDFLKFLVRNQVEDENQFTQAVGIVICNYKTPIKRAKKMAEDAVESVKKCFAPGVNSDGYSFQLFESLDPPMEGLNAWRERLYKTKSEAAFSIIGQQNLSEYLDAFERISSPSEGLPRHQLYRAINKLRKLNSGKYTFDDTCERINHIVKRSHGDNPEIRERLIADLKNPIFGEDENTPGIGLVRIAEMWDLMRPFVSE